MSVQSLGYIGFRVNDVAAWTTFLMEGLGLMKAGTSPAGRHLFRTDSSSWRIALEQGPEDDVAFVGYETADKADLNKVRSQLKAGGVDATTANDELLEERDVLGLLSCTDPRGIPIEIFYGALQRDDAPFVSPVAVDRFVTGDQGLGHILLSATNMSATRKFYGDALGFRLSDIIALAAEDKQPLELEFYHCNSRHHSVAFMPMAQQKILHHFMLQVGSMDEVGFTLERLERLGARIALSLGRHSNDQMISFYAETPSGFLVEFGYGAINVDVDTWRVAVHNKTSIWGHKTPGPQPAEWKPPV